MEENSSFDNLDAALDTDFVTDDENTNKALARLEEKKNELVQRAESTDDIRIEDAEYMRYELKMLIMNSLCVLEKLSQDIQIGSKVREHEVYFSGVGSVRDIIKELRELDKNIADLKLAKQKTEKAESGKLNNNGTINNFYVSNEELEEMMDHASKNNSLNDVEAKFQINDKEIESK